MRPKGATFGQMCAIHELITFLAPGFSKWVLNLLFVERWIASVELLYNHKIKVQETTVAFPCNQSYPLPRGSGSFLLLGLRGVSSVIPAGLGVLSTF